MNLTRLVYYSQSNPSEKLDVSTLVGAYRSNNKRANITGMLHHNGDYFVQVIEGGRVDVSALYQRVAHDARHSNLILLSYTNARERLFPTYPMRLHQGMNEQTRAVFLRYFASEIINPETVDVDCLLDALQDLALEVDAPGQTKLTISV